MDRILLLEDKYKTLQLYKDVLMREGFYVTGVTNTEEALLHLRFKPPFDLIVLDYYTPFIDELGFIAQVKLCGAEDMHILLLSDGDLTEEHGQLCGIEVIQKPVTTGQLKQTIESILG